MTLSKNILILGGDLRQNKIQELLVSKNYTCTHLKTASECENINQKIPLYDVVILPVPVSHDDIFLYSSDNQVKIELDTIVSSLCKGQLLIGGSISENLRSKLSKKSVEFFDFYENEELVLFNAYLTAQGALRLILENTDEYLSGKKVLITGYGRVAKASANILRAVGLDVYICVRNQEQKITAKCEGYKTLDFSELLPAMHIFDFILNTVPANVFDKTELSAMKTKAKYFELASVPYGIDKENFEISKEKFIKGNALPGRFLPSSAGEIITKIIEPKLD
ncbi:MAG: dipicolinate synthase subunit DpsA [Clostridia bacterium]